MKTNTTPTRCAMYLVDFEINSIARLQQALYYGYYVSIDGCNFYAHSIDGDDKLHHIVIAQDGKAPELLLTKPAPNAEDFIHAKAYRISNEALRRLQIQPASSV